MNNSPPNITQEQIKELRVQALQAAEHAYSPYSHIKVGAALLTYDDRIFTGCNVENASYGLTICAERSAVSAAIVAISENRERLIRAMYVTNHLGTAMPPCGACRQVLVEFGKGGMVYFRDPKGPVEYLIDNLLPSAFSL